MYYDLRMAEKQIICNYYAFDFNSEFARDKSKWFYFYPENNPLLKNALDDTVEHFKDKCDEIYYTKYSLVLKHPTVERNEVYLYVIIKYREEWFKSIGKGIIDDDEISDLTKNYAYVLLKGLFYTISWS